MAREGGKRMAELLRGPDQLSILKSICRTPTATVAQESAPQVAEGPLPVDQSRTVNRDILAQAGNPTSVAGPTIRRQFDPREEPRALTGLRGSARGVLSNGDSYRNRIKRRKWTSCMKLICGINGAAKGLFPARWPALVRKN